MHYRVDEIAREVGISVGTLRYYQSKRLIDRPVRDGRHALYDDSHLDRLRRIRELADDGLSLAIIERVLSDDRDSGVAAEAARRLGSETRRLTLGELATETGVPEALLVSAEAAGLLNPTNDPHGPSYSSTDAALIRAGLELLGHGIPFDELMSLAVDYANKTDEIAERAIDLFDDHVRKSADDDPRHVVVAFDELLPVVTRVVALQFQRALLTKSRSRLAGRDDFDAAALTAAIERATEPEPVLNRQ